MATLRLLGVILAAAVAIFLVASAVVVVLPYIIGFVVLVGAVTFVAGIFSPAQKKGLEPPPE